MEIKQKKLSQYKAPNGAFYEQNDIDYLLNSGYVLESALEELSKTEKYTKPLDEKTLKAQALFSKISGRKAAEGEQKVEEPQAAEAPPAAKSEDLSPKARELLNRISGKK